MQRDARLAPLSPDPTLSGSGRDARLSRSRPGIANLLALALLAPIAACGSKLEIRVQPSALLASGIAVEWMDLLQFVVKQEALPPTSASRLFAYAGIALFEGTIIGDGSYRSLGGQLNALGALPAPPPDPHDPAAVANRALAQLVRGIIVPMYLPTSTTTPFSNQAITSMEQVWNARRQEAVPADVWARSVAHGDAIATALVAWANADGWAAVNAAQGPYVPPVGPGLWIPTPTTFRRALQPTWGTLRTFVLIDGDECAPPPPTPYSTDPSSAFHREALEVYDATAGLTPVQREIALHWSDDPGVTSTPPGHWVSIVGQLCVRDDLPLAVAAEAYARVGLAVGDAFISCWRAKYVHNLLRPVTYIQEQVDHSWLPLLGTPPFPEYPSGHSTQSGAVARVLTDLFGIVAFADWTHAPRGLPVRFFVSFDQAADEAAISRLFGGIHFRPAIDDGVEQGRCIGQTILDRVSFRT